MEQNDSLNVRATVPVEESVPTVVPPVSLADVFASAELEVEGQLSKAELHDVTRQHPDHADDLARLFSFLDTAGTGSVDLSEFLLGVSLLDHSSPIQHAQEHPHSSYASGPATLVLSTSTTQMSDLKEVDHVHNSSLRELDEQLRAKASTISNLHSRQQALLEELRSLDEENEALRTENSSLTVVGDSRLAELSAQQRLQQRSEDEMKRVTEAHAKAQRELDLSVQEQDLLKQHVQHLEQSNGTLQFRLDEVTEQVELLRQDRSAQLRLRLYWSKKRAALVRLQQLRNQEARDRLLALEGVVEECEDLRYTVAELERVDKEQKLMLEDLASQFDASAKSPLNLTKPILSTLSNQLLTAAAATPSPKSRPQPRHSASVESFRTFRLSGSPSLQRWVTGSDLSTYHSFTETSKSTPRLVQETKQRDDALVPQSVETAGERGAKLLVQDEQGEQSGGHCESEADSECLSPGQEQEQEEEPVCDSGASCTTDHGLDGEEAHGGGSGGGGGGHGGESTASAVLTHPSPPHAMRVHWNVLRERMLGGTRARLDFASREEDEDAAGAVVEDAGASVVLVEDTMCVKHHAHPCTGLFRLVLWLHLLMDGALVREFATPSLGVVPCCDFGSGTNDDLRAWLLWPVQLCLLCVHVVLLPFSALLWLVRFTWQGGEWVGTRGLLTWMLSLLHAAIVYPILMVCGRVWGIMPWAPVSPAVHTDDTVSTSYTWRRVAGALCFLTPTLVTVDSVLVLLLAATGGVSFIERKDVSAM